MAVCQEWVCLLNGSASMILTGADRPDNLSGLQVSRLQQQALQVHPSLAASSALSARIADTTYPPDVENEANAYYQQVGLGAVPHSWDMLAVQNGYPIFEMHCCWQAWTCIRSEAPCTALL